MTSIVREVVEETRQQWRILSFYERFEQVVTLILTVVISLVIVLALAHLLVNVVLLAFSDAFDPSNQAIFQTLFGMIMTLLIALEFKHSILRVAARHDSIIQVKTVLLIALLALSRKFIILDLGQVSTGKIAALAGALLALGVVYWLMRERDDRLVTGMPRVDDTAAPRAGGA